MACDDCGACPSCGDELEEYQNGYLCPNCGTVLLLTRRDLARFEEDPDRRPYIWDLEED